MPPKSTPSRRGRNWSPTRTPDEYFWPRVRKSDGDGCWEWTGRKPAHGYGILQIRGKQTRAHRHSWEIHFGPIPDGLWVLHRCDNPACVRPDHLFLGTVRDNTIDAYEKGRLVPPTNQSPSDDHWNARLTWDTVREIRRRFADAPKKRGVAAALSREFGISPQHVCNILHDRTWIE